MDLAKRIDISFPTAGLGFPGGTVVKNPSASVGDARDTVSIPGSGKCPTPVFLPGKFHGQRSLAGYSPWGRRQSDTTEHTHNCRFSLPQKTKSTQDSAMGQFPLDHSYRPRQVQKAYTHTHTHRDHSQISLSLLCAAQRTGLGKLI